MFDKLKLRFWNGKYYCKVSFPDGSTRELKSVIDLTFTQWVSKAQVAWDEYQIPKPKSGECQCPECNQTFVCPNRGI